MDNDLENELPLDEMAVMQEPPFDPEDTSPTGVFGHREVHTYVSKAKRRRRRLAAGLRPCRGKCARLAERRRNLHADRDAFFN